MPPCTWTFVGQLAFYVSSRKHCEVVAVPVEELLHPLPLEPPLIRRQVGRPRHGQRFSLLVERVSLLGADHEVTEPLPKVRAARHCLCKCKVILLCVSLTI